MSKGINIKDPHTNEMAKSVFSVSWIYLTKKQSRGASFQIYSCTSVAFDSVYT